MLMLPVTFKIKACDLTRSWTSKARDLKGGLLEFFRSSEKTAPWVITIRPLSTAGSTAPGHTNNNTLINNVSDRHLISSSKQNLQITFRLQADPWNHNQSDTTEKKKRRDDDEEKLQRRQPASHAEHIINTSIDRCIRLPQDELSRLIRARRTEMKLTHLLDLKGVELRQTSDQLLCLFCVLHKPTGLWIWRVISFYWAGND